MVSAIGWLRTILALVALGVSAYLLALSTDHAAGPALCGEGALADCDEVLDSRWAHWMGMPVSLPAVAVYLALAVTPSLEGRRFSAPVRRTAAATSIALAALAAGAGLYFSGVQLLYLRKVCPFCMTVHACGLAIAGLVAARMALARRSAGAPDVVAAQAQRALFGRPVDSPRAPADAALWIGDRAAARAVAVGTGLLGLFVAVQAIVVPRTMVVQTAATIDRVNLDRTDRAVGERVASSGDAAERDAAGGDGAGGATAGGATAGGARTGGATAGGATVDAGDNGAAEEGDPAGAVAQGAAPVDRSGGAGVGRTDAVVGHRTPSQVRDRVGARDAPAAAAGTARPALPAERPVTGAAPVDRAVRADPGARLSGEADAAAAAATPLDPGPVRGTATRVEASPPGAPGATTARPEAHRATAAAAGAPAVTPRTQRSLLDGKVTLVPADEMVLGDPAAPYLMAELFDYTCPHCRRMHGLLKQVRQRYGDTLAIVLLPAPLNSGCNRFVGQTYPRHLYACLYPRLALEVWHGNRAAFEDFHDWLMEGDEPPPPGKARDRADRLCREGGHAKPLSQRSIDRHIRMCVEVYGACQPRGLPRLLFPGALTAGAASDIDELTKTLQEQLGIGPTAPGAE